MTCRFCAVRRLRTSLENNEKKAAMEILISATALYDRPLHKLLVALAARYTGWAARGWNGWDGLDTQHFRSLPAFAPHVGGLVKGKAIRKRRRSIQKTLRARVVRVWFSPIVRIDFLCPRLVCHIGPLVLIEPRRLFEASLLYLEHEAFILRVER